VLVKLTHLQLLTFASLLSETLHEQLSTFLKPRYQPTVNKMTTSNLSILNKDLIERSFDVPKLNSAVESACKVAVNDPKALYIFMQRYVHFNGYAGSLVARLASSIGLSRDLFNNTDCNVIDEADRGMEIAAKVIAATIDEHADQGAKYVPHRTLAQATLKAVGNYAGLSDAERNEIAVVPDWMKEVLAATVNGYQGVPGDATALIRAMGFHAASEILADREYSLIDKVVRYDNRGKGFDAYLRTNDGKVKIEDRQFSAWYWIVIHGKHQGSGVEAEHFQCALEAIDLAAKYRPESNLRVREIALQGFTDFVKVQQRLFAEISRECSALKVLELV
jgi:hypothetical protein